MKRKISLGLVFFREKKFLEKCLQSLATQNCTDFEILFRDQSSNFFAAKFIEKNFAKFLRDGNLKIFCGENVGHSAGQNFLIEKSRAEIFVVGSVDAIYPPNFFAEILKTANENLDFEIFAPKILRLENSKQKNSKRKIIDSCGISFSKNWHFFERGANLSETKFTEKKEIFGATGATIIFRREKVLRKLNVIPEIREANYPESPNFKIQKNKNRRNDLKFENEKKLCHPELDSGSQNKWEIPGQARNDERFCHSELDSESPTISNLKFQNKKVPRPACRQAGIPNKIFSKNFSGMTKVENSPNFFRDDKKEIQNEKKEMNHGF